MTEETKQEEQATETAAAPAGLELSAILGVKAGMSRFYDDKGASVPVTVIDLSNDTVVTQVKTDEKEGYNAVQVGFRAKKQQRANKAEIGHFKASGAPAYYNVEEIKTDKKEDVKAGTKVVPSFLEAGAFVDVRGVSKGKGFQGPMKRWNFGGMPASHGHSLSHRSGGSIGANTSPGKVYKGRKMAGHMGNETKTVQNLKVVEYDAEKKVLLVKGAIPGGKNGLVRISKAVKK